jgi:hypothetical protein
LMTSDPNSVVLKGEAFSGQFKLSNVRLDFDAVNIIAEKYGFETVGDRIDDVAVFGFDGYSDLSELQTDVTNLMKDLSDTQSEAYA